MRDEQLSTNFKRSEFACPGLSCCGGAAPVDMRLIALLQKIRDAVEAPITVSSGFRCPRHNAAIGGVPDSYHTLGHAADIYSPKQSFHVLYMTAVAVIRDYGYGHVIPYAERGFVHVDIHSRAWNYSGIFFTPLAYTRAGVAFGISLHRDVMQRQYNESVPANTTFAGPTPGRICFSHGSSMVEHLINFCDYKPRPFGYEETLVLVHGDMNNNQKMAVRIRTLAPVF